jgi:hypothetical protein
MQKRYCMWEFKKRLDANEIGNLQGTLSK